MTKQESLFFAIGHLDESLLQQSEYSVHESANHKERNLNQKAEISRHALHKKIRLAIVFAMITAIAFSSVGLCITNLHRP